MNFFCLSRNFGKQDKIELLAKFKNILYIRFRATLNFDNFKVALTPMRILLKFVKSCVLSYLSKFDIKKNFHCAISTSFPGLSKVTALGTRLRAVFER